MGFGVGGLMSGLDTESLISQMMQLERRPIQQLQIKEAGYQAQISAFGSLKGALTSLQASVAILKNSDNLVAYKATSGNADLLTVSISDAAAPGEYQVEVSRLAQAQQVRSSAFTASDNEVGTGTLTIKVGTGAAVEVAIDDDHSTLAGIVTAINDSDADVTAGVVHDGAGNYYLTLSSKNTGADNTISFTIDDDDGIDDNNVGLSKLYFTPASQSMDETQTGLNAALTVNGIPVVRAGNTIDDLVDGATLTLNQADPGNSFALTVARDDAALIGKLKGFIGNYNKLVDTLKGLQSYDPATKIAGTLQGDSLARQVQGQLRGFLHREVDGVAAAVNSLSELGVEVDKDGKLSLDETVFTRALESNRADVVDFFTLDESGNEGFAVQLDARLDTYLNSSTGVLAAKKKGIESSIQRIGDQVERIELRLAKREENLRRQFENLEKLMAQFQVTSSTLDQQLQSISNLNASISRMKR